MISVKLSIKNGNGAWDILYYNKPNDAKCKFRDNIGKAESQSNRFSENVVLDERFKIKRCQNFRASDEVDTYSLLALLSVEFIKSQCH